MDYHITHIRKSSTGKIDSVRVAEEKTPRHISIIIGDYNKNINYYFVDKTEVHVVKVGNLHYLRTDKNSIPADNLGNLPEF